MKTRNKALLLSLCAVLLVCTTIFGTLAYLTDTDKVQNTFTVGRVGISLDEAKVKTDGTYETDATNRVQTNKYHLLPGHTYTKDPTVHVDADSEDCYVFVKVENGIANIEAATSSDEPKYTNVAGQMATNGWTALVVDETDVANTYYYQSVVAKDATNKDLVVFSNFKIDGAKVIGGNRPEDPDKVEADKEYLGEYDDANITVTAYAVQAAGFDTAAAAWAAANFGA